MLMSEWIDVCGVDEVPEDGTLVVRVRDEPVCLYHLEGEVFATHDRCTHASASLGDGFIAGGAIQCPIHMGTFDIRTGRALTAPCVVDLRVYPVRLVGARVQVKA
jgi:nitrite reductase/ring-hydroxylating ferredoxin subunit